MELIFTLAFIYAIVIDLKNSYFPLINLPSGYRTDCYRTVQ